MLYEDLGIANALISDLTWDTDAVHMGHGVAVSLRDRNVPRQRFLAQVRSLASQSGVAHQWEVESEGSSDAAGIQRSGSPWNWVFVGAPERHPHTNHEEVRASDLNAMADMLVVLAERL